MEQDWDLHAVVRGCCSSVSSTTASASVSANASSVSSSSSSSSGFGTCFFQPEASSSGFSIFDGEQACQSLSLSAYPFEARGSIEELHELYKPFFTKSQPLSLQTSPLSSFSYSSPKSAQTTQEKQQQRNKQPHSGGTATTPRSKRRKNQMKKICQVPVENLSSDIWAWRKYGQKPIKGSPYPRGYYRCSSSKGCLARKQVERNRSDPTMFIVTYTAEHNHPAPTHRNSLAGSTRQKPLTPQTVTEKALTKPTSPATSGAEEEAPTSQGEKSESREEEKEDVMDDEEGDEFGLFDMVVTDDFFESLDDLSQLSGSSIVTGDCFNDPFSVITIPTWVANSAATTAGGC